MNPVFILAGGLGTRIRDHSEPVPKPMVTVADRPVLWHIMKKYSHHGFKDFVICTGFRSEVIKRYFLEYGPHNSDFTVDLRDGSLVVHQKHHDEDWRVTVAYTGETAQTGARVARAIQRYLGTEEHFGVTYGDGLTDADLSAQFRFHKETGRAGTVLGVNMPSRWGEFKIEDDVAYDFVEKPDFREKWINGGYFWFSREALHYLKRTDDAFSLESDAIAPMVEDEELAVFKHQGFWKCMDTQRERQELEAMWRRGDAPWAPWRHA